MGDEESVKEMKRRDFLWVTASAAAATALGGAGCESVQVTARRPTLTSTAESYWETYFMEFSQVATGFSQSELQATGQSSLYFTTVRDIVGTRFLQELLQAFHKSGLDPILSSPQHGPIARNIVKLWYIGSWEQLPKAWSQMYGSAQNDVTFVVSSGSYIEGLLWPAIGSTPPAAKAPGYASWVNPPAI